MDFNTATPDQIKMYLKYKQAAYCEDGKTFELYQDDGRTPYTIDQLTDFITYGNNGENAAKLPPIRGKRKKIFNDLQVDKVNRMLADGFSKRAIARTMGVSHTTILNYTKIEGS